MMKKSSLYFFLLLLAVFAAGCEDTFQPDEAFLRIYDDQLANRKYFPLDIEQADDGGYIILSALDDWDIHVQKISSEGDFVWSYISAGPYVNPVPGLLKVNGSIYFFCMAEVGLFTYLMRVDDGAQTVTETSNYPSVLYPLAASVAGQNILLQNYDRDVQGTGFHKLSSGFVIEASSTFNIFENVEERVVDHITHAGDRLPFFTGAGGNGGYFMNGFYNYSFSVLFTDNAMGYTGVHNGSNYNGAASSVLPLGGGQYAVSRFSFGNNYINPQAALSSSGVELIADAGGTGYPELEENAHMVSAKILAGNRELIAVAGSTISNKIVIYLFDAAGGALVGKKYIGNTVPYRICDFSVTTDGGLIVLAQVYVAGSYPRIAVIKLSDEEVLEMANAG